MGRTPSTKKREKQVAKEEGGRRVAASGATPWQKEDVITDHLLIQHKDVRIQKTHTVRLMDLEELRKNAIDEDKLPVYMIDTPDRRWYIIDDQIWDEVIGVIKRSSEL